MMAMAARRVRGEPPTVPWASQLGSSQTSSHHVDFNMSIDEMDSNLRCIRTDFVFGLTLPRYIRLEGWMLSGQARVGAAGRMIGDR